MENFINYFNAVTTGRILADLIDTFSGIMDFMFTPFTVAGHTYSVITLVFGAGLTVYLSWSIIKFFLP